MLFRDLRVPGFRSLHAKLKEVSGWIQRGEFCRLGMNHERRSYMTRQFMLIYSTYLENENMILGV